MKACNGASQVILMHHPMREFLKFRLPLTSLDGLDLAQVTGFAFSAGAPEGKSKLLFDDVLIK